MAYMDELIRVTSEPIRLQPRSRMHEPFSPPVRREVPLISLPFTASVEVYPWESGCILLLPVVRVVEPNDPETWDLRFRACCEVAEVLVDSFGGTWWREVGVGHSPLMEIVYRPRAGSDLREVEREAVGAFATHGMNARRQSRVTR